MGIRISCSSGDIYKDVKRGTVPLIKKGIWTQYSFFFFFEQTKEATEVAGGIAVCIFMHFLCRRKKFHETATQTWVLTSFLELS